MSIKLMSQAWETGQKGNDLLVLLALCDFANDEGLCYPSLKTLSIKSNVSKTSLSYILRAYEEIGVITRKKRLRKNKSTASTFYKINHLEIDLKAYKQAYQKARKYSEDCSQCEHPEKTECEHLEPSYYIQGVHNFQKVNKKNLSSSSSSSSESENERLEELNQRMLHYQISKDKTNTKLENLLQANKENEVLI